VALVIAYYGSWQVWIWGADEREGTWRARERDLQKELDAAKQQTEYAYRRCTEIHRTYQAIIETHVSATNLVSPDVLVAAARQRLQNVQYAGDFVGFAPSPTVFYELSVVFKRYGTPVMYDAFLQDTNPVVRAMGLLCYARTDPQHYETILRQFASDITRLRVYHDTCNSQLMMLGKFAQNLHDDPKFLSGDGYTDDFLFFKALVALGEARPERLIDSEE